MDRMTLWMMAVVAVVGVACVAAGAAEPVAAEFSDVVVEEAISKGVEYLWKQQADDGGWGVYKAGGGSAYPVGMASLAAYALMESGVRLGDPRMAKALKYLSAASTDRTYSLSLRCQVWLAASRQDKRYLSLLRRDVEQLIKSTSDGSYGYESRGDRRSKGDNSNSQFALLGVWAGAQAGIAVPKTYWRKVTDHWTASQQGDGRWPYQQTRGPSASMTAAGVASLQICFDNLMAPGGSLAMVKCQPDKAAILAQEPIQRGLKWFDANFRDSLDTIDGMNFFYYLYCVERVGLAGGRKHFGDADWYKLGSVKLLKLRKPHGAWHDTVNTAFAVLFLLRGRHAVLFNKLQFAGDWNNRPRALATLTQRLGERFERTLNWQIVNVSLPVHNWQDAPIVYISGSEAPKFTEADLARLRKHVYQGGTLLSVTECKGAAFSEAMRQIYAKLFAPYELTRVPPEHSLYSGHPRMSAAPALYMVSNGVRPLAIHTDSDLSLQWQLDRTSASQGAFQIMANLFTYLTDNGHLRRRGTSLWPQASLIEPVEKIKLARLKYAGNYDPEPLAWERLNRLMRRDCGIAVEVEGPMDITSLPAGGSRLATLTGTGPVKLSDAERKSLKAFLEGGGTLLIDAAGGDADPKKPKGFVASIEKILAEMYPNGLKALPPTADLFHIKGMELGKARWRQGMLRDVDAHLFRAVFIGERPAVLFTRYDITAALVGYPASEVDGYEPGTLDQPGMAFKLMRNILLQTSRSDKTSR